MPNRCTRVDAASPDALAAAAKVRASGPAARTTARAASSRSWSEIVRLRGMVGWTITERSFINESGGAHGHVVGKGRAGGRRYPRGRARDRRRARGGGRARLRHRAHDTGAEVRVRAAGDDRGDRGAGHRGGRPRHRGGRRPPGAGAGPGPGGAHRARVRPARRAGQRHLGRRAAVRLDGEALGARPGRRPAAAPAGRRDAPDHQPPRAAAADPPPGRAGGGDDRRHGGVQRGELPGVRVLRPGQVGGAAAGLEPGPRAGRVRRAPRSR